MVKGIWSASILGGLIVWAWFTISWMVLPWHCAAVHSFENESALQQVIDVVAKKDGIYRLPSSCSKEMIEAKDVLEEFESPEIKTSKIIFMSVNSSGLAPKSVIPYTIDLITNIVVALFVSLIVMLMAANSYGWKVFAITLLGLICGIYSAIPSWIWFGFPLEFGLLILIDCVIGWFIASLVMAALIRPKHII